MNSITNISMALKPARVQGSRDSTFGDKKNYREQKKTTPKRGFCNELYSLQSWFYVRDIIHALLRYAYGGFLCGDIFFFG